MCYILCVMDRVGVRELRQNLSVYLRRVGRGETLEVTERGRPVAVLRPIDAPADAVTRLIARGVPIRRGQGSLADLPPPPQIVVDRPLSEEIQDMREERL
jgi:prevent-host-death family protein